MTGRRDQGALGPARAIEAHRFDIDGVAYALFEIPAADATLPPGLSPAERSVTQAVLQGKSNEAIARARGTSPRTVANQLRSIYAKLGISSRLQLVGMCKRGRS